MSSGSRAGAAGCLGAVSRRFMGPDDTRFLHLRETPVEEPCLAGIGRPVAGEGGAGEFGRRIRVDFFRETGEYCTSFPVFNRCLGGKRPVGRQSPSCPSEKPVLPHPRGVTNLPALTLRGFV